MIDSHSSTSIADPGLIENRLGLQCIWEHPIRGKDAFVSRELAGLWTRSGIGTPGSGWAAGTATCSSDG